MEIIRRIQGWDVPSQRNCLAGLAITILLHAVAFIALLQYEPVRSALTQAMPIIVSLITPQPVVEKPQLPNALPVRPKAPQPTLPEPKQLITAVSEALAPLQAPTPPSPAPVQAAPSQQAAAPVAPAPVIPPNFNADYLDNPPPIYPALSRRIGEQGKVMLRVLVNAKGTADKIELRSSSGSSRLDDAALDSVKRWRFVPARQGDQPVAAWVLIPITFSLKG
jgi:protein TonB